MLWESYQIIFVNLNQRMTYFASTDIAKGGKRCASLVWQFSLLPLGSGRDRESGIPGIYWVCTLAPRHLLPLNKWDSVQRYHRFSNIFFNIFRCDAIGTAFIQLSTSQLSIMSDKQGVWFVKYTNYCKQDSLNGDTRSW